MTSFTRRSLGSSTSGIEGQDLSEEDNGCTTWATFPATRIPPKNEEQTSWRLDDAPWEPALAWVPNYISVGDHKEFEGLMDKMTLGEFKARFGEDRGSSLAVIVEDEEKDRTWIIQRCHPWC